MELVHLLSKGSMYDLAKSQSLKVAIEKNYQTNLIKFADNSGIDEHRRPVDKREFRETREILNRVYTYHMGWFCHEPIGYKSELLSNIGYDFSSIRLSTPLEIVMEVAEDSKKWYAWRRTVGGHYFAIGAHGDPPNKWRYDGCKPPTGFARVSPEWGVHHLVMTLH